VYTWSFTPERFAAAKAAGAKGLLAKSMSAEALVEAIELLARDEEVVSTHFGRSVRQPWPGHDLGFTLRESEVAIFLAQGLRNRDIANALWVSENTVKTHLKSIFQKTSVSSRAEAIVRISRDVSFTAKRNESHGAAESTRRSVKSTHPKR
jgi:DNA-binding NarL/FixJ family response regulator